jgi:predicted dehydrogenase
MVGTGPWATMTVGPGLHLAEGADFVGVWGRDITKTRTLAAELGVPAYVDYQALLGDVDAVAFSVPPDVQADLALMAAHAGKHLLLDKPIALSPAKAHELVDVAATNDSASVVFFTDRFVPKVRLWLAETAHGGGWRGGWARWFSALQEPDNPFGSSPWRQELGALWDTGPHALSNLITTLGPISSVRAEAGEGDLVSLVMHHESGALSTATMTQFAPLRATCCELSLWGEQGFARMPDRPTGSQEVALALAAVELIASAQSGEPHDVDAAYGARIVDLLVEAAASLARPRP